MRYDRLSRPGRRATGAVVAVVLCLAAACAPKPVTIHVQGTVRRVGRDLPIAGADVLIEWPATLGGGQSQIKTNREGQFAVGRTLRRRQFVCAGVTVTVQAEEYATAYARHDEDDCGDGVLDFPLVMLPQPR